MGFRTQRERAGSREKRRRKSEPVSNPSARSMCDPCDLNRRCASAAAGLEPQDHKHGHTPRSMPSGSGAFAVGRSPVSPLESSAPKQTTHKLFIPVRDIVRTGRNTQSISCLLSPLCLLMLLFEDNVSA